MRGADFDNDSAFMNDVVVPWCRAQKIEVTRSRAYKKNDQAFVEQKNGAVVRRLVGYGRFDGVETARVMARLYAAARLHVNFFLPSFKLKEKRREGAKVIKRYHDPAMPPKGSRRPDALTCRKRVSVTPALDDKIGAEARARGMTEAEWMREVLNAAVGSTPAPRRHPLHKTADTLVPHEINQLWRQIKKLGTNVNQLAHQANLGMVPIKRVEIEYMLNRHQLVFSLSIAVLERLRR